MSLANWFRHATAPRTSPRLESLVLRVAQYLESHPSDDEFAPKIIGAALSESELAALTALSILEERGITKHHFGVYCARTGVPLESYDDLQHMREELYCEICDRDHVTTSHNCKIEIYFTVDRGRLGQFLSSALAA